MIFSNRIFYKFKRRSVMLGKPVAWVGDTGSHGGTIIDGSPTIRANNRLIALG